MTIKFDKNTGLVPAIIQDEQTKSVLMLGYMNEAALAKTEESGRVTFFSRSKNRLWTKGETSGNFLEVVSMQEDCDGDAILVKAKPLGPVCHTGADTCFEESNTSQTAFIDQLRGIIKERKENPSATINKPTNIPVKVLAFTAIIMATAPMAENNKP